MLINKYIVRNIIISTATITTVVCLTISIIESVRLLELLVNKSISVRNFFTMVSYLIPQYIGLLLPFALFAATINTYKEISHSREIHILRSSGMSNVKLAFPVIKSGIYIALFTMLLNTTITPMGWHGFKVLRYSANQNAFTGLLTAGKFVSIDKSTTVFVREVKGNTLYDVILYTQPKDTPLKIITARKGGVLPANDSTKIVLYEGSQQIDRKDKTEIITFKEYVLSVNLKMPEYPGKSEIDEYTSWELGQKIYNETAKNSEKTAFYRRILDSFLSIILSLIAGFAVIMTPQGRTQSNIPTIISIATMLLISTSYITTTIQAVKDLHILHYSLGGMIAITGVLMMLLFRSDRHTKKVKK